MTTAEGSRVDLGIRTRPGKRELSDLFDLNLSGLTPRFYYTINLSRHVWEEVYTKLKQAVINQCMN